MIRNLELLCLLNKYVNLPKTQSNIFNSWSLFIYLRAWISLKTSRKTNTIQQVEKPATTITSQNWNLYQTKKLTSHKLGATRFKQIYKKSPLATYLLILNSRVGKWALKLNCSLHCFLMEAMICSSVFMLPLCMTTFLCYQIW